MIKVVYGSREKDVFGAALSIVLSVIACPAHIGSEHLAVSSICNRFAAFRVEKETQRDIFFHFFDDFVLASCPVAYSLFESTLSAQDLFLFNRHSGKTLRGYKRLL